MKFSGLFPFSASDKKYFCKIIKKYLHFGNSCAIIGRHLRVCMRQ